MAIDLRDSIKSGLNSGVRQSISSGEITVVFLITQGLDRIVTQSNDSIIGAVGG
jgi:hypothetical protein